MMSRSVALLLAIPIAGCPSSRDNGAGGTAPGTTSVVAAPAPALHPSASVLASATPQPEADQVVPLVAGEALGNDPAPTEAESSGAELLFAIRPRHAPGVPVHLGAVMTAVTAAQNASAGVLRVVAAAGRVRVRVGPRAFALEEGWELRADRARGGSILLFPNGTYRVIPSGAFRAVLAERRIDVMPLGPTHLASLADGTHLGRTTTRTRVTTAWGTLDIDQMTVAMQSKGAAPIRADARGDAIEGEILSNEPGGEPLCRMLLELVAADRALGGAPCNPLMIPLRAEISFAVGGGISFEATSVREGAIARSEVAFPPAASRLSNEPLPDAKGFVSANDVLHSLRAKGEPATLEVSNKTPSPRWLFVDGVPVALIPGGADRPLSLRASRYVVEWRTPLGEIIERATEVEAPGRHPLAQWVPPPLSSASPIASARNGP
jgi:hypothetical protein